MSTQAESFGELLRQYRVRAGLSQDQLAEVAGLSRRGVTALESGARRLPYPDTARRLADALGLEGTQREQLLLRSNRRRRTVPKQKASGFAGAAPKSLTTFVGRVREVNEVFSLVRANRLVTLTGPGGVGKTRLAEAVAQEEVRRFRDRVCFVELAGLSDHRLVSQALAATLEVREVAGESLESAVVEYLESQTALLVLDNCEHVLPGCTVLVHTLLSRSNRIRILATSREPLHVPGEVTWAVPALSLPPAAVRPTVAEVAESEAVRLFVDRVAATVPRFVVTDENAALIAHLCRRLDGIPLALELAAARVRALGLVVLNERLSDRFVLLKSDTHAVPPRQQTLRATIDWSYTLLTGPERQIFERLSVFPGDWDMTAAESVCSGSDIDASAVLDQVTQLVDKSMVQVESADGSVSARHRLLDTLRHYAGERLDSSGGTEAVRRRHALFFLGLVEQAEADLRIAAQRTWLIRVERELDNVRAAVAWTIDAGEVVLGVRLASALSRFWEIRGHVTEGRLWLNSLLGLTQGAPELLTERARLLAGIGRLEFAIGNWEGATSKGDDSRRLYLAIGDQHGVAASLRDLGRVAQARGDYLKAIDLYEESLSLRRVVGDEVEIAECLNDLAEVARHRSDYDRAEALDEEALALQRKIGDSWATAYSLHELANVARHRGDYKRAATLSSDALRIQRELSDRRGMGYSLNSLGLLAEAAGDADGAGGLYEESLGFFREVQDKRGVGIALAGLSRAALKRGDHEQAFLFGQESLDLFGQLGERRMTAGTLCWLGNLMFESGDLTRASAYWRHGLNLFMEIGDPRGVAQAINGLALVASLEAPERAIALMAGAAALNEEIGAGGASLNASQWEHTIGELRARVGETDFKSAWEYGQALSRAEVVDCALGSDS